MGKSVPTGGKSLGKDKKLHASMGRALMNMDGAGKELGVGR